MLGNNDTVLTKSFFEHACVEIVETPSIAAGAQIQIESCLAQSPSLQTYAAFIDAHSTWVPGGMSTHVLKHVLWVKCATKDDAISAADVVMRDENFRIILMDLRGIPRRTLKKIQYHQWYRLQKIAQNKNSTLIVVASYPSVCSAQLRVEISAQFDLSSFHQKRSTLADNVHRNITRQRPNAKGEQPWIDIKANANRAS